MSRILVVDDDSGHRIILKSRLGNAGHEVIEADNGARGLVAARSHTFDAFLIAAGLSSGVDGYEVCRRLKAIPETNGAPLLLFHAQTPVPEDIARGFDAGCDAFLSRTELPTLEHVLRLQLRVRQRIHELHEELRAYQGHARRAAEERARPADGVGSRDSHDGAHARDHGIARPDGVLVVDGEGLVRQADRGARELLGARLEHQHLGSLAPATRLEAFVRDARIELRDGFRFDLSARKGHAPRSLTATVVPLVVHPGDLDPGLRVVLLYDAAKRRTASEHARVHGLCLARPEAGALVEAARCTYRIHALAGDSDAAAQLRAAVQQAVATNEPVFLRGEHGSGKERIARTLHYSGASTGAFLQIHCGAVSSDNLELELFGFAKGAHAGAHGEAPGLLHLAQDGTLYLEEIQEAPLPIQERLVRFLRDGALQRVGSSRSERLDVRLIFSASEPIESKIVEGQFARELAQHLEPHTIGVPTLVARGVDIDLLAQQFLERYGTPRKVADFSADVRALFRAHAWPENIGELENTIEQACLHATGPTIEVDDLPRSLREQFEELPGHDLIPARRPSGPQAQGTHSIPGRPRESDARSGVRSARLMRERGPYDIDIDSPLSFDFYEKMLLLRALDRTQGDKLAAAKLLNLGKSTLYRKLKRYEIS